MLRRCVVFFFSAFFIWWDDDGIPLDPTTSWDGSLLQAISVFVATVVNFFFFSHAQKDRETPNLPEGPFSSTKLKDKLGTYSALSTCPCVAQLQEKKGLGSALLNFSLSGTAIKGPARQKCT